MDNFIVSARKYRPLTFDAVVGQETITSTLKNAIKTDHLAHAYLFCGPRGVGKTTCARIFAKTINCQNVNEKLEPCNECESCKAFVESRSYNIHELDAASNNSVEDIRNLTDQVRIPPQIGKYSTYIIDEVHMLSASAFNAFLKTLEEPPAHALFILATTEKQKIIPTILSRCQIFDFNRIRIDDMVNYLQFVADQENIKAEPDALTVIASKADGSMRDALSIFDQLVSFAGNTFGYKEIIEHLNVLDYDYYFRLTDIFLKNNLIEALMIFNEILENGFDGHHFITGMNSHFRDLLVCKDPVTVQLLEVGASIREKYLAQSKLCPVDFLYKSLEIFNTADISYKNSNNQRLHVELALLKLCQITGELAVSEDSAMEKTETKAETPKEGNKEYETSEKEGQKEEEPDEQLTEGSSSENQKPENPSDTGTETVSITDTEEVETDEISKPEETIEKTEEGESSYTPSTTSIKDALNGLKKNNTSEDTSQENHDKVEVKTEKIDFNEDELTGKWQSYADSIKPDKPRLSSTLKTQLPSLKENYLVEVEMNNRAQKEDFDKVIKADLLQFLRNELQNSRIEISSFVVEEENNENSLYTDEEKFRHLNQINPNLGKMKQQFNLDFE